MSVDYKSKGTSSLMHRNLVPLLMLCIVQWKFGYPTFLFLTELSWDMLGFYAINQRLSAVPSPFSSDLCINISQANSGVWDIWPKESSSPNSNIVLI